MSSTSNASAPSSAAAKAPTEEKIQPGDTHCLLFGAARPSDDTDGAHETALSRQFTATKMDLAKMVDWCASFGELNSRPPTLKKGSSARSKSAPEYSFPVLISFLVNDKSLIPSEDMLSLKGKSLLKNGCVDIVVFTTKDKVSQTVKSSVDVTQKNVIIFFSGHGTLTAPRADLKKKVDGGKSPEVALESANPALLLPISTADYYYTDEDLTTAVATASDEKNVYLVLHACNSGGMFRDWQLKTTQRDEKGLSIALFASAATDSTSVWDTLDEDKGYVAIFTKNAKVGHRLIDIQSDIFTASLKEKVTKGDPGHSPCLVAIRPSMAEEMFLPK